MLSLRTADSTRFKRLVTERLADRLESLDPSTLAIPLGTLTNVIPFSALGPSVRVRVQSVGDIQTSYVNEFTSAGVNQTKHSIYLQVDVTVYLLIPGEIVPVTVQDRVCVAETIIVGEVPDTYLNFKNGAN
jgi:sporulation protein YunB